jgi:hypothetical protein
VCLLRGQGPKNCWFTLALPIAFCFAPATSGTLKPFFSPSGSDVVEAGMSQIAQCFPLFARSMKVMA